LSSKLLLWFLEIVLRFPHERCECLALPVVHLKQKLRSSLRQELLHILPLPLDPQYGYIGSLLPLHRKLLLLHILPLPLHPQ